MSRSDDAPQSTDVADDVPDADDDVPDVADDVPDVADDVPDVADGAPDDADDVPDVVDEESEPFTRYQNSIYRLISMSGAAVIAVLGITGFVIGRTLDPAPPSQFFLIDGILTVLLFGWYLLGMRCRLDVAESWVHVATKYSDFHCDRDRIVSIEPDRSTRGSLQWSGRPLIIRYRDGDKDDTDSGTDSGTDTDSDPAAVKVKLRKAYGCLPNDAQSQEMVIERLQGDLGRPDGEPVAEVDDDGTRVDLEQAVAARLATMDPKGEPTER